MSKIIGVLLFACFLAAEARYTLPVKLEKSQNVEATIVERQISYRLPTSVIPKSYTIELDVYLDEQEPKNFTFYGQSTIALNVTNPTKTITLHSQNLTIKKLNISHATGIEELDFTEEKTKNFLHITKQNKEEFIKNLYVLNITYEGELNDDLRGFYRSHYINDKGEKVWLAATHFEPVSARRAFPCFDEPALKATFNMKITHDENLKAIFNTKEKSTKGVGRVTTEFETTPEMSTYLVAFVVSNFINQSNAVKNFTVHARPNAAQFGKLAVEEGEQILKQLGDFTDFPFEKMITKMDQIAIPQFTAGAMENWGLVTYREQYLLFDDKNSTTAEKQSIVETIAHEFAHQWFGDLVSPKWWKYLWLNEGFANFFQSYITEKVEQTWRSVEQSVVTSIQSTAFIFDSSNDSHPINHDVESPKEISKIFDSISYQKGGAIIRMMQHYLTDNLFQKGLQQYLKDNKLKAADSDDLFKSIQTVLDKEKSKINIKNVMNAWVNKKGYPIVTVTRDYAGNKMNLTQDRFFTYNASAEERKDNLWEIPINYATQKNPDFKNTTSQILFNKTTDTIAIDAGKDDWVIVNKQQTGFYRVNYDEDNWKLIIKYLQGSNREMIHPLNRAQLINDALAFVQQEILSLETLLQLSTYLKNETDYIAWYPAIGTFSYLRSKLINTEFYPVFKEYVLNTTEVLVKSVGLEPSKEDDHIKKLNRIRTISLICSVDKTECLTKMAEKVNAWLKDEKKNAISKDLKLVTLCHGLRNASHGLWEQVLNKSKTHEDYSERLVMTTALSCVNDKNILEWYLHYALSTESSEYLQSAISSTLANSEVGVDVVLDFVSPNIFKIHWKIDDKKVLIQIVNQISNRITTKNQLEKLKAMKNLNIFIPDDLLAESVSVAEENLNWIKKYNETLTSQFIRTNLGKGGVGAITSSIGLIGSLLIILISNNL